MFFTYKNEVMSEMLMFPYLSTNLGGLFHDFSK